MLGHRTAVNTKTANSSVKQQVRQAVQAWYPVLLCSFVISRPIPSHPPFWIRTHPQNLGDIHPLNASSPGALCRTAVFLDGTALKTRATSDGGEGDVGTATLLGHLGTRVSQANKSCRSLQGPVGHLIPGETSPSCRHAWRSRQHQCSLRPRQTLSPKFRASFNSDPPTAWTRPSTTCIRTQKWTRPLLESLGLLSIEHSASSFHATPPAETGFRTEASICSDCQTAVRAPLITEL